MAVNGKNAVAIDWDGVCVQEVWPRKGGWLDGAREGLRSLADQYDVYIWTTRIVGRKYDDWHSVVDEADVADQIDYIRGMLDTAGLEDVHIFVSYPDHGVGKISAKAYVDDRAIRFEGDWTTMVAAVQGQVPAKPPVRGRRKRQRV